MPQRELIPPDVTTQLHQLSRIFREARAVARARDPDKWQQQYVATRAGVSSTTVANAEKCARMVRIGDLLRIAKVLGIKVTLTYAEVKE